MKICPKCEAIHGKTGTYCSRSCANSRSFTEESKAKKRKALIGRTPSGSSYDRAARDEKVRQTALRKYNATPFEELGSENKRRRVLEEQNHCCNKCGLSEWLGVTLSLEVDHIDGNNQNNNRENLEGLCPNCHSITPTWRGRNKPSKNGDVVVTDEELKRQLAVTPNIRQALLAVGLSAKGGNYARAKRLL